MKKKYVCLNKPCIEGNLCEVCSKRLWVRNLKIGLLYILAVLLFVTSIIEYQHSYIWFFSSLGDSFVFLYNSLPSFVRTFLKVALFSVPVILFGGLIVALVWLKIQEMSDYRY